MNYLSSKDIGIVQYKPFLIQTASDGEAWDTRAYGLIAKSEPAPYLPDAKEVYNNDWHDEDGDDEYNIEMHYEAIEFEVQFFVRTVGEDCESELRQWMSDFFAKVRHGEFKTYDTYTGIGYQGVRYVSYKEDEYKARVTPGDSTRNWAQLICTVTFKANDPTTTMVYNHGQITEGGLK